MELFNKYKNKNFTYITNYINLCINDDSLAMTSDELSSILLGSTQNTFDEFIDALLNKNKNGLNVKSPNADLLYFNEASKMLPIRDNYIPIRPSIAEIAWLYYILKDNKTDLFIDSDRKSQLISVLEENYSFPNISRCVDIKSLSNNVTNNTYARETVQIFRDIVSAINEHKELIVTNTTFNGQVYSDQKIYPYKIEYSPQFDSFSLSAYPLDTKRPVKMNLQNLSKVSVGEIIADYDKFIKSFEKQLTAYRVKEPISIEIKNDKNGYDRCSYKFSSFDRVCYENEHGNLIMNIYYYRFQKEEILKNLLFLGPTSTIISPEPIKEEYITMLKNALIKYEADI